MNKAQLLQQILQALEVIHQGAVGAALQAYTTATHKENVAENKYDTLGLEASYLAQGQSQRVAECAADLAAFKKLAAVDHSRKDVVAQGALIQLADVDGAVQYLFLGPAAGGLKLTCCEKQVVLITPASPLGKALSGHFVGDEVELRLGDRRVSYEIVAIY